MSVTNLRPNGTVTSNGWSPQGAPTLHEACDDPVIQPTAPNDGAHMQTPDDGKYTCEWALTTETVTGVSKVTGWVFVSQMPSSGVQQGQPAGVTLSIRTGATVLATRHVTPSAGTGWHSVTYNGTLSQGQVDDLRLRVVGVTT